MKPISIKTLKSSNAVIAEFLGYNAVTEAPNFRGMSAPYSHSKLYYKPHNKPNTSATIYSLAEDSSKYLHWNTLIDLIREIPNYQFDKEYDIVVEFKKVIRKLRTINRLRGK